MIYKLRQKCQPILSFIQLCYTETDYLGHPVNYDHGCRSKEVNVLLSTIFVICSYVFLKAFIDFFFISLFLYFYQLNLYSLFLQVLWFEIKQRSYNSTIKILFTQLCYSRPENGSQPRCMKCCSSDLCNQQGCGQRGKQTDILRDYIPTR